MGAIRVEIEGESPLLMHNGRLADPIDEFAIAMKKVTAKRLKTVDDYTEIMRLEFLGGLYYTAKDGVYIPAENIESAMVDGGKIKRRGMMVKQGVQVLGAQASLIYDGPRTAAALWADKAFRDTRRVRLNKSSSMIRCRPRFDTWRLAFTLACYPEVIDPSYAREALVDAGQRIGLGDYHMRYGKFKIITWDEA